MSEQREFLGRLVDLFGRAGIPYMLAGSLSSSFHGRPRATNDVDMVIAPTDSQFGRFLDDLGSDYYVSKEAAWSAFHRKSEFNIIDMKTQWKADLWIRDAQPFSVEEFDRRQRAVVLGVDVWVASPEDVILSKLAWAKDSGSPQQIQDVLGVLQVQHEHLDREYLRRWAQELGVADKFEELIGEVERQAQQMDVGRSGPDGNFAGRVIVLDGPDGCGKSSQARMLMEWLQGRGVATAGFRDPGATVIGEKIREILLSTAHEAMTTPAEVLLYMAARVQLWAEKIKPALSEGKCVVLDRWLSSTCAYQGYAGGFGMEKVIGIARDSLERVWPDLTVILDVDLKTAAQRLHRELDRMERKGDGYHSRVREGFLKLAQGRPDFVVVDATAGIEAVHKEVIRAVQKMLEAAR
jgi:dTMP kinase